MGLNPMVSCRISLVTYLVRDYDEAIAWFEKALGFHLIEDLPQGDKRWVVMAAEPGAETRMLLARAVRDQEAGIGDQAAGRVAFFLSTDDFDAQHARMIAAGVAFEEEPRREPYGTVAVFRDLYGNRWDLIEYHPPQG